MISARAFNALVASRRRNRVIDVRVDPSATWRHPWSISCGYDSAAKSWRMAIKAGFVNGLAATLDMPDGEETSLTEFPLWPITELRAIGPGSGPTAIDISGGTYKTTFEPVPPFFKALGVGDPPTIDPNTFEMSYTGTAEDRKKQRRLLACDVVLYQDHASTMGQVTVSNADTGVVSIDAAYTNLGSAKPRAYLRQTALYEPPKPADDPLSAALKGWSDPPRTELHLATVYFLSAPGLDTGEPLDSSWSPYVRHRVWWNLAHGTNVPPPAPDKMKLEVSTGLAGGTADSFNQFLLSQVNDANAAVAQFFASQRIRGKFYSV